MVPVAADHVVERLPATCRRRLRPDPPARHFVPDEHADLVGGFEIRRVTDLDVAPEQVEPELPPLLHGIDNEGLAWRAVDRVSVEILIERPAHVERLAIQEELTVARDELAKAEVLDRVVVDRR